MVAAGCQAKKHGLPVVAGVLEVMTSSAGAQKNSTSIQGQCGRFSFCRKSPQAGIAKGLFFASNSEIFSSLTGVKSS